MHQGLNKILRHQAAGWIMGLLLAGAVQAEDPMQQQSIEAQIEPVGSVVVAGESASGGEGAADESASKSARSGTDIYNNFCIACHGSGVAGAPKTGDEAAWAQRAEKGMDGLLKTATEGLNAMPPKGTCADCSQVELQNAIEYMLSESGVEVDGGAAAAASEPQQATTEPAPEKAAAAGGEVDLAQGKQIYQTKCFACHGTGAAGAPIVGKSDAWAPRIDKGMDTLMDHTMNGFNAMPPKGTCMDCSEAELRSAVTYMIEESQ